MQKISAPRLGEEPIYDIAGLSLSQKLILGLQHTFAMFGATVLVPILTGLDVSTTLLMAGLGTFLFHIICKGKVPAFLGSSFAFLGGYAAIAPDKTIEQLAKANGGVMAAGFVYIILAAFIYFFKVEKVMRFFPPVVTGPIIIAIGLTLAPIAVNSASTNWPLALLAIGVVIVANIWGKGMVKIVPILLGLIVSYIFALITNQVDFTQVSQQQILSLPIFPERFATFDLSAIITIMPIALATMMEHIGDISAISATTGQNFIAKPGLHRSLIGDGVATMMAAFLGGPANTTYGENTGVLALTKVYDPKVVQIAAGFAVFLSFFPIISQGISTIPAAIIGGISLILYGMISAIGVRNVVENQVDLTKSRNLIIAAAILVCALGFANNPLVFNVAGTQIQLTGLAIASLVGIILNAILPGKDYVFKTEEPKAYGEGVNFSGVDTSLEGKKEA